MKSKLRVAWENQRAELKREQEDAVNTPVRHNFTCGCLVIYFDDANRAGLAWCPQHDRAYQEIGNILPQLLESGENIENIYQLDGMAKLQLRSEEMDDSVVHKIQQDDAIRELELQKKLKMQEAIKREWFGKLDERQRKEVEFARIYAKNFAHGTDGHHRLLLIAKLCELLDA